MPLRRTILITLVVTLAVAVLIAIAYFTKPATFKTSAPATSSAYIVLAKSPQHSTFVQLLDQARLKPVLNNLASFTIFAPTNAAFTKLPPGALDSWLQPNQIAPLTQVLTYHITAEKITSADFARRSTFTTIQGRSLTLSQKNGKWYVNDYAAITSVDLSAGNGIIHFIDTSLSPR